MKRLTPIPEHDLGLIHGTDFVDKPGDTPLEGFTPADLSWIGLNNGWYGLTRRATVAASNAYSWRGRNVGAAAYVFDQEQNRMGILTGFNLKPEAGDSGMNIHAEQMLLEKTRRYGFTFIGAMAIWGEPQVDDEAGLSTATVHPCGLCRDELFATPEVTDRTAILSTNAYFSVCEIYSLPELTNYYATRGAASLLHFTVADRALDRFVQTEEGGVWQPNAEYEGAVGLWLMHKWAQLNPDGHHAEEIVEWFEAGQPTAS